MTQNQAASHCREGQTFALTGRRRKGQTFALTGRRLWSVDTTCGEVIGDDLEIGESFANVAI